MSMGGRCVGQLDTIIILAQRFKEFSRWDVEQPVF